LVEVYEISLKGGKSENKTIFLKKRNGNAKRKIGEDKSGFGGNGGRLRFERLPSRKWKEKRENSKGSNEGPPELCCLRRVGQTN